MPITFTAKNFETEVLQSAEPVLVDFWAPWCGPCRALGPVIDELDKELEGRGVKIGKVNVDEEPALASRFEVMSIPTIILFKGGSPVDQLVGVQTKEQLKKRVAALGEG